MACQAGHAPIVSELIERKADINAVTQGGRWTPLIVAAVNDRYDVVALLLQRKADHTVREEVNQSIY